jgi:hypothetical protein
VALGNILLKLGLLKEGGEYSDKEFIRMANDFKKPVKDANIGDLFHKLWGQAHDAPEYNKEAWGELQTILQKCGFKV